MYKHSLKNQVYSLRMKTFGIIQLKMHAVASYVVMLAISSHFKAEIALSSRGIESYVVSCYQPVWQWKTIVSRSTCVYVTIHYVDKILDKSLTTTKIFENKYTYMFIHVHNYPLVIMYHHVTQ